jgi:hypothetical protein
MISHSEKGLKTIDLMGTKPTDWALTPIDWQFLNLIMPTKIDCPTCCGRGRTYVNLASGKPSKDATFKNINDRAKDGWKSKNNYQCCPACYKGKTRYPREHEFGSGKTTIMKMQRVLVGRAVWAKGTLFDSRFSHQCRSNVKICDLCSKSIKGIWSFRIPVQARGADGRIHGMWVGEDCAKKILGVEVVLTDDQKLDLKKSVYKHWIIKE